MDCKQPGHDTEWPAVLRCQHCCDNPLLQIHPQQHQKSAPHPGGGAVPGLGTCHLLHRLLQLTHPVWFVCTCPQHLQAHPEAQLAFVLTHYLHPPHPSLATSGFLNHICMTNIWLPCCQRLKPSLLPGLRSNLFYMREEGLCFCPSAGWQRQGCLLSCLYKKKTFLYLLLFLNVAAEEDRHLHESCDLRVVSELKLCPWRTIYAFKIQQLCNHCQMYCNIYKLTS